MIKEIRLAIFILVLTLGAVQAQDTKKDLTAHKSAGKFKQLDLTNIPSWDKDTYEERYREIRDKKFLSFEGEPRRIPWLFGRDGCHVRATHFNQEAQRLGYEVPKKIFIFGSLQMRGAIIPHGAVEPWFHAAPIVLVEGEPMVLDPSVSFSSPLTLKTWSDLIIKDKDKVIYSICSSGTYLPTSSCNSPKPIDKARLDKETQLFLKFERNILHYIGLSFD